MRPQPLPTVPTLEPLAIHAAADRIRDAHDRVVILRGANYSGLEFGNFIGNQRGPDESDFAQMASWGFNVIRLPIAWNYLEPQPNQFDDTYLREQVDRIVQFAADNEIVTVLEMHQFFWSACFTNGNGAPAWACQGHDYPDSFNGALRAGCEFLSGALAPDGRTLQEHFIDVWRMIARRYAGDRRVAGFDFLNEPSPVACGGDPTQVTGRLYDLYRRLRDATQAAGATQTFFLEPTLQSHCLSTGRKNSVWCGRRDLNPHGPCGPTDFHTRLRLSPPPTAFAMGFGVWTIPSPCPDLSPGVRLPSSLYTFPA